MKYVFDTNVFRGVQAGSISQDQVLRAKARVEKERSQTFTSPVALMELGSHFTEANRGHFAEYRDAFRAMRLLCRQSLPIPEEFLRNVVFGDLSPSDELSAENAFNLCLMAASAETYDDLHRPRLVAWGGGVDVRAWHEGFFHDHRAKIEAGFVDMVTAWQKMTLGDLMPFLDSPPFVQAEAHTDDQVIAMLSRSDIKFILNFLKTPEHFELLARGQAIRVKATVADASVGFFRKAAGEMSAYLQAITYLMRRPYTGGYNGVKNKNDFSDIHLLAYLADPEMVLVTNDQRIKNLIQPDNPQLRRIALASSWFQ